MTSTPVERRALRRFMMEEVFYRFNLGSHGFSALDVHFEDEDGKSARDTIRLTNSASGQWAPAVETPATAKTQSERGPSTAYWALNWDRIKTGESGR